MLKRVVLLILIVFFVSNLIADYRITRGPAIGEIYFLGPTVTDPDESIYHSTDFGETATCVDSISDVMSICADKTPGVLYYNSYDNLFYSNNYGNYGSWVFRKSDVSTKINSGVDSGFIYCGIFKHSENSGIDFFTHECIGFVGNVTTTEIDNQNQVAYANIHISGINDSIFLYITYDNYNELQLKNSFNIQDNPIGYIRRGTNSGELFTIAGTPRLIKYSDDYGESWEIMNRLNYGGNYIDFVGGRQEGEIYILSVFDYNLHSIAHIYIYHSTDYGKTFEAFHPFAKGEEPLVANFSTAETDSIAPLTVQFSNYSIGDIQSYEWDFDNDGTIDSYEEEPSYTYEDPGYYSVKLSIYDSEDSVGFLREDYIHVTENNAVHNEVNEEGEIKLSNAPNPFTESTTISFNLNKNITENLKISIYNIKGEKIKTLPVSHSQSHTVSLEWDGKNSRNKVVCSGIYFVKLRTGKSINVKKIIKLDN